MSQPDRVHCVAGEFDSPEALRLAIEALREQGYTKMDALTPYPVHGLDKALGLSRSWLGYVVFAAGAIGAASALLLQWWTGAVDYPLVIGGKPYFAFEFSIPVTFELTVLFASFAVVLGMLVANGLPRLYHPVFRTESFRRVTNDGFLLVVERDDKEFDAEACRRRLEVLNALRTEIVEEDPE